MNARRSAPSGSGTATRVNRLLRVAAGLFAVAAVTAVLLTSLAAGAEASRRAALGPVEGRPSTDARYYRSSVTSIQPAVSGLTVTAQGDGLVSLTNDSGKAVTVLGYTGEPYLRIAADGVDENAASLSAVLNTAVGRTVPVAAVEDDHQPRWRHRDGGDTAVWRDYRTRWGSAQRPAIVSADPHHAHPVSGWALQLTVDGRPVLVHGVVRWTGSPRFSRGQLSVLVTGLLIAVAGVLRLVSRRGRAGQTGAVTRSVTLTTTA